ncbi:hypothetical protein M9H77_03229 [Catharanthus roseus]|uniref:Uncharacterized protein n=1 Tax=Catharanthus roseus TaxID=4058 RepID=A0ACC0CB48_CATRO|nr:hypothetical protein M9H77_03229 [Catharanthus roseus]
MSMEVQLSTHYNEGTSGSSHSNLDLMNVIMQELQLMRKDMKETRGNITNLSMEHRDQSNIGGQATSHSQWSMVTSLLMLELFSIILMIGMRAINLELEMVIYDISCKIVPRNEVKNGGNCVKMDEMFHKRRGDVKRFHDSYDHYEHSW